MSKQPLFFLILLLLSNTGFNNQAFAEVQDHLINGSWTGTIDGEEGPPATRVLFHAEMKGTFKGDTSSGEWIGEFDSNYLISPMGLEDEDTGIVTGTYFATIDDDGRLVGEGRAKVTGVLTGEIEFKFSSTTSILNLDDPLPGIWNGTLTSQSFTYGGTPIEMTLKLSCSGEFEGLIKSDDDTSQTITGYTTNLKTSETSATATTTSQTTSVETESKNQQLLTMIFISTIIVLTIISGIYILRKNI
jgi:hypothetical protein